MADQPRAGRNELVKVRVTGEYTRTETQDFTFYLDVPPPPNNGDVNAEDAWCALVHDEIHKLRPKGWRIRDWDAEIDATGEKVDFDV